MKLPPLFLVVILGLAGCAGPQYFEARSVEDAEKIGVHHRSIFARGDTVILCIGGEGWYGKEARVNVRRDSDGDLVYHSARSTVLQGRMKVWPVKLPPGKYHALVYEGDQPNYSWDFMVLP